MKNIILYRAFYGVSKLFKRDTIQENFKVHSIDVYEEGNASTMR